MILAVPDPQKVQFGPRPSVISAAMLFVHSWTPITEGAQSLMNSIKYGLPDANADSGRAPSHSRCGS
jgi:hypothetical protein